MEFSADMKRFRNTFFLIFAFVAFAIYILTSVSAYSETEKETVTADDLLGVQFYAKSANVKDSNIGIDVFSIMLKDTAKSINGLIFGPELLENDIIIEVEGKHFKSFDDFLSVWNICKMQDSFNILVLRRQEIKTVTLKKDDFQNWNYMGMPTQFGVIIKEVDSGGPAYKAGIKKYDRVVKMNQEFIADQEYFDKMVEVCKPGETLNFEILRGDEVINTEIRLENPEIEIKETVILDNHVNTGEKLPLISIKATGNLDINSSFVWTKVGLTNGKQISLKKHNSTVGLTVENSYDEETGEFTSILCADKIRQEAEGEYFCQIKDRFNTTAESDKFTITVQ